MARDNIIALLPNVLFVISGREKLKWDKIANDNWGDLLHDRQHLLGNLSDHDARDFLASCQINESTIQDKIIADSEGVPYYLDLCIEIYQRIEQQGNTPTVDDFSHIAKDELFHRFMCYLDRAESETLKVLAHARYYTAELFSLLVEEFKTGYPISALSQLNQFSFISQQQERFYIHDLMRKSLTEFVKQDNAEQQQNIQQFLFEHYNAQLQNLDIKNITATNIKALPEAFYYQKQLVATEALWRWANNPLQTFRKAAQYNPALDIWQQLQLIIEAELGQEHIDTATVLHNIAYLYNNMGKYSEAEPLYKSSLAIREKALGKDHPSVAISLNNLAGLYYNQEKYSEAVPLLERALEIVKATFPDGHPILIFTRVILRY